MKPSNIHAGEKVKITKGAYSGDIGTIYRIDLDTKHVIVRIGRKETQVHPQYLVAIPHPAGVLNTTP